MGFIEELVFKLPVKIGEGRLMEFIFIPVWKAEGGVFLLEMQLATIGGLVLSSNQLFWGGVLGSAWSSLCFLHSFPPSWVPRCEWELLCQGVTQLCHVEIDVGDQPNKQHGEKKNGSGATIAFCSLRSIVFWLKWKWQPWSRINHGQEWMAVSGAEAKVIFSRLKADRQTKLFSPGKEKASQHLSWGWLGRWPFHELVGCRCH